MVKNLPPKQETPVRLLDWEGALEEGIATHSSILAWKIPMDRGACWAIVQGVTKSQTQLSHCKIGHSFLGSLIAQLVKNPPAMQETPVQFLGQEDPLEKG